MDADDFEAWRFDINDAASDRDHTRLLAQIAHLLVRVIRALAAERKT